MKRLFVCLFTFVACSLFLMSERAVAQSPNASRPSSEQSLQELVSEVRQLRAALQRINVAVYKGQVMIERLKLQQEMVARLSHELVDTRDKLSDLRLQQVKLRELLGRAEPEVEAGVKHPSQLAGLKAETESVAQREQRFAVRETQLAAELELERAKLNELNEKLNALELEMAPR